MAKEVNAKARAVIGDHYSRTGQLPTFDEFVELMGYASHSSAHYLLQQLVEEQFLAKTEGGRRRYAPGPLFVSSPGKTALPPKLMELLPAGNNVRALQVDENWRYEPNVCLKPGDLVLVAPLEADVHSLEVFRRGRTYEVRHQGKRGWQPEGVLLGLYRPHPQRARARA